MAEAHPLKILFVCSMNERRSLTAEKIFSKQAGLSVRSAGTVRGSRRHVSVPDIRWADVILVMEQKHANRLQADFRDEVRYKDLQILGIPDEYPYMDEALIALLDQQVASVLGDRLG